MLIIPIFNRPRKYYPGLSDDPDEEFLSIMLIILLAGVIFSSVLISAVALVASKNNTRETSTIIKQSEQINKTFDKKVFLNVKSSE